LILPDIHVVKLGGVTGLYLDLLGYFPAGEDPVAFECPEEAFEVALFDLATAFQRSSPNGIRIFQVHVERGG
jgi:hypothetical protein